LLAFGLTRIKCKLGRATVDVSLGVRPALRANANQTLENSRSIPRAANSDAVTLRAAWPASEASSLDKSISIPLTADPRRLGARRCACRGSRPAGTLPVDATAVGEDDATTEVTTVAHAIRRPEWIRIVIRDARGGIATEQLAIHRGRTHPYRDDIRLTEYPIITDNIP